MVGEQNGRQLFLTGSVMTMRNSNKHDCKQEKHTQA